MLIAADNWDLLTVNLLTVSAKRTRDRSIVSVFIRVQIRIYRLRFVTASNAK